MKQKPVHSRSQARLSRGRKAAPLQEDVSRRLHLSDRVVPSPRGQDVTPDPRHSWVHGTEGIPGEVDTGPTEPLPTSSSLPHPFPPAFPAGVAGGRGHTRGGGGQSRGSLRVGETAQLCLVQTQHRPEPLDGAPTRAPAVPLQIPAHTLHRWQGRCLYYRSKQAQGAT